MKHQPEIRRNTHRTCSGWRRRLYALLCTLELELCSAPSSSAIANCHIVRKWSSTQKLCDLANKIIDTVNSRWKKHVNFMHRSNELIGWNICSLSKCVISANFTYTNCELSSAYELNFTTKEIKTTCVAWSNCLFNPNWNTSNEWTPREYQTNYQYDELFRQKKVKLQNEEHTYIILYTKNCLFSHMCTPRHILSHTMNYQILDKCTACNNFIVEFSI
jgi:hypothetical protein